MGSIISRLCSWLGLGKSKLRIIVVGGGLSGLATAIASALSGHDVIVLESAKELAEVDNIDSMDTGPS